MLLKFQELFFIMTIPCSGSSSGHVMYAHCLELGSVPGCPQQRTQNWPVVWKTVQFQKVEGEREIQPQEHEVALYNARAGLGERKGLLGKKSRMAETRKKQKGSLMALREHVCTKKNYFYNRTDLTQMVQTVKLMSEIILRGMWGRHSSFRKMSVN